MADIKAVLFDLGGTLYDYRTLARAEGECLVELARWLGIEAGEEEVLAAYRDGMKRVFRRYLPLPFYFHRDLFRDALREMAGHFGRVLDEPNTVRYEALQWERYRRDFALREGVVETLAALRERGLYLGIVSNIDEAQLRRMVELGALGSYFDSTLSSEAARSCKPHAAIFEMALSRAGCAPSEALFVGDALAQDIEGANRVGMRSVLLWYREDRDPPAGDPAPRHVIHRIPDLLTLLPRAGVRS